MHSDKDLVDSINKGDKKSFEVIFHQYYGLLCVLARRYLKDADLSEEVVCEVFFSLWEKHSTINIDTSLKNYLLRATHNRCMNIIRHNKVRLLHSDDLMNSVEYEDITPHNHVEKSEIEAIILQVVDSLPTQCQKIFKMSREEHLSNNDIATKLNISVNTVKTQLSRGTTRLREALKDYLYTLL